MTWDVSTSHITAEKVLLLSVVSLCKNGSRLRYTMRRMAFKSLFGPDPSGQRWTSSRRKPKSSAPLLSHFRRAITSWPRRYERYKHLEDCLAHCAHGCVPRVDHIIMRRTAGVCAMEARRQQGAHAPIYRCSTAHSLEFCDYQFPPTLNSCECQFSLWLNVHHSSAKMQRAPIFVSSPCHAIR